jgi:hypothetical protein
MTPDSTNGGSTNSGPTSRAALDDFAWFDRNPARRFRARAAAEGVRLIRRRSGNVLLRTLAPLARVPSCENEIEARWWMAAWPDLSPKERAALIKESRRGRPKRRAA